MSAPTNEKAAPVAPGRGPISSTISTSHFTQGVGAHKSLLKYQLVLKRLLDGSLRHMEAEQPLWMGQ